MAAPRRHATCQLQEGIPRKHVFKATMFSNLFGVTRVTLGT